MSDSEKSPKRRYLRFEPDEIEIAQLQFVEAEPDDFFFKPEAAGLVIDESYEGCALAVVANTLPEGLAKGTHCQIKINKLGPMRAELRWIKELDEEVWKIGVHYLDQR